MRRCQYIIVRICCSYSAFFVLLLVATTLFIANNLLIDSCLEKASTVDERRKCFDQKPINNRHPSQIYVWSCRESPWNTKKLHNLTFSPLFRNYFNATMTYRRDSEIDHSYMSQITRFSTNSTHKIFFDFFEPDLDKVMGKKRYLALFVSAACDHTAGATKRYNNIMKMAQKGFDVHVYGRCFGNSHKFPAFRSRKAVEVMSQYKFYFAYENSPGCRDYVTEKFWENALYSGAVPIVQGPSKKDLEAQAPPNSYIFADDYLPGELMKLLEHLDRDKSAYSKYFEWRRNLQSIESDGVGSATNPFYRKFFRNRTFGVCDLCRSLHTERSQTFRPISSLESFWYGTERAECFFGDRQKHTQESLKTLMRQQVAAFPLLELQPDHVGNSDLSYFRLEKQNIHGAIH